MIREVRFLSHAYAVSLAPYGREGVIESPRVHWRLSSVSPTVPALLPPVQ